MKKDKTVSTVWTLYEGKPKEFIVAFYDENNEVFVLNRGDSQQFTKLIIPDFLCYPSEKILIANSKPLIHFDL